MKTIDFENNAAVGTRDASAATDTPTILHEDFDFDSLDSIEDIVRQRVKDGESLEQVIQSIVEKRAEEYAMDLAIDKLTVFLAEISSHKKPIMLLDAMCWLLGISQREGRTIPFYAQKHGCTKQAFEQFTGRLNDVMHLSRLKGIRGQKLRTARDESARAAMGKAWFPKPGSAAHKALVNKSEHQNN